MGPPGGGRNDITSRFSRHLNIISIDEFDDDTMSRIFTSICDWHFGQDFDGAFLRLGKVTTQFPWDLIYTKLVHLFVLFYIIDARSSDNARLQGDDCWVLADSKHWAVLATS